MATLTETAHFFRRALVIGVLVLLGYFILNFGFGLIMNLISPAPKHPLIPVEVRFGKLPQPNLGTGNKPPKEGTVTYTLETISGGFPSLPAALPVFAVTLPKVNLLVTQRAVDTAARLGFNQEAQTLTPIDYLWRQPDRQQTLKINILTGNFTLTSNLETALIFPPGKLPQSEGLALGARNWLANSRALDKSFSDNSAAVTLQKQIDNQLVKADGYSEAEVARVDFFREVTYNGEAYRLLTIKPQESLLYLLFGGGRGDPYLISSTIWNYDLEKGSTYPIKPSETAWKDMRTGLGAVVALTKDNLTDYPFDRMAEIKTITIRDVSLAYFDEGVMQNYLQPVYVFSGQADLKNGERLSIVIYVPAVNAQWLVK